MSLVGNAGVLTTPKGDWVVADPIRTGERREEEVEDMFLEASSSCERAFRLRFEAVRWGLLDSEWG